MQKFVNMEIGALFATLINGTACSAVFITEPNDGKIWNGRAERAICIHLCMGATNLMHRRANLGLQVNRTIPDLCTLLAPIYSQLLQNCSVSEVAFLVRDWKMTDRFTLFRQSSHSSYMKTVFCAVSFYVIMCGCLRGIVLRTEVFQDNRFWNQPSISAVDKYSAQMHWLKS